MNADQTSNLDQFRKRSSFNKIALYHFLFSEDVSSFRANIYLELNKYPILYTPSLTATVEEQRRLSIKRLLILLRIRSKYNQEITSNAEYMKVWITSLWNLEISSIIQYFITIELTPNVIKSLGTERHLKYYNKFLNGEYIGIFGLTEVGHGTNTRGIQTTATYDKETQEFVLNTPNFKAAKCWIGNLGKIGTHAIMYANLITPDGINHGMHCFVVEVRNPKTYVPHLRITIADMGEKIELNGIDNGILIFDQYRIPRENLLNRLHDVTVDGNYVNHQRIKNPFAFSFGVLSNGRTYIASRSSYNLSRVVTIAIRYSASKVDSNNLSLLEDQVCQVSIMPYLASAYVTKIVTDQLMVLQHNFFNELIINGSSQVGEELHTITSAAKPVISWLTLQGIKDCLQTCEEMGHLISNDLSNIRNVHDINCTTEGENTVLIQQTSNSLLKLWPIILKRKALNFPLKSLNYVNNALNILEKTFKFNSIKDLVVIENILSCYQWLVCYNLKKTYEKQQLLSKTGQVKTFWIRNQSQTFYCQNLAFAYMQTYMIQQTHSSISTIQDSQLQLLLSKLLALFGVWNLQKHVSSLYEGGYVKSSSFVQFLEDAILYLCQDIKNEAVCLTDVIGPSDDFIKSAIGRSDGQLYDNFRTSLINVEGIFSSSTR